MGFAERLADGWRARYKNADGLYVTLTGPGGKKLRFSTQNKAEKAADAEEAKIEAGIPKVSPVEQITFGEYASRWYEAQNLAVSTMQNYKRHIEEHLLPAFQDKAIGDILSTEIDAWEKRELAVPYAASSVKTWRGTLHVILADAIEEGLRESNPATKRQGRGIRTGRSQDRGPEKVVTTALGILLIAERAALLSGRDDEFVGVILKGYTGMRWGEIVGLETQYVRPKTKSIRVEWQLYELDSGVLHRCPPKEDSYRDIDTPEWLSVLLAGHVARTRPTPCACHHLTYVFRGHGTANGAVRRPGAKLIDVARRAGVSAGTVSNFLNRPDSVAGLTRVKVETAVADLGYVRNGSSGELAPHWRRNGFAQWLFQPATTGWYPKKAPQEAHPVPVLATPWPGVPARGRNASGRAEACWLPIVVGLTPHGLRHTHRTLMEELGTPPTLMNQRMGHRDSSVQGRYSHVTPEMRRRLMEALNEQWEDALDARRAMCPGSPVAVLDALLRPRQ